MKYDIANDVKRAKSWECFFMLELGMLMDLKLKWNPDRFIIDWSAIDKNDNIISLIEAKVRKDYSVNKWDNYMVGLRKYQWGVNYQLTTGIPFILAFRFNDAIVTYKHDPDVPMVVKYSGRSVKIRHSQDVAPCVHIKRDSCRVYTLPYPTPNNLVEHLNTKPWKDIKEGCLLYLTKCYEGKAFNSYG